MVKGLFKLFCMFVVMASIILFGFNITTFAQPQETDVINEALNASGGNQLEQTYSEEVKRFFEENNIKLDNPEGIMSLNPKEIIGGILTKVKEMSAAPIKLLMSLMAIIILASLIQSISDTTKSESLNKIFDIITILVCILIFSDSVCECIEQASVALSEGAIFMLGFVPVFASIAAGSGNLTSAGVYNVILVLVSEIAVQLASGFLMPLLSLCLALSIVDSINPAISLSSLIEGIKKTVTWCLGLMMTIFVGLLSIQSIIGNSADTLSVKTGKFMVSNFVPVVGGAISDAYTTLKGSFGLLKSGVGGVGIMVILIMVLPTIITIGLNRIVISIASIGAEIFSVPGLAKLFKNISSVISIAFSIVISFSIMFIVSTALIMAITT
ncbi:MAG: hypothetical protein GX286_04200 [Clostridiales bacterium]|nr:hypothetical protein [Clostridiales bacterium]